MKNVPGKYKAQVRKLIPENEDAVDELFKKLCNAISAENTEGVDLYTHSLAAGGALALEKLGFRPYALSPAYNFRGHGELISGKVRIWHSHEKVPPDLNAEKYLNEPRRIMNGKDVYPLRLEQNRLLRWGGLLKRAVLKLINR